MNSYLLHADADAFQTGFGGQVMTFQQAIAHLSSSHSHHNHHQA